MKIEISCDDGNLLDFKIAEKLESLGLNCTFYLPSNCELSTKDIQRLAQKFEIGGHTYSHFQDLKKIVNDEYLEYEIKANKDWLEELTGKKINKFCYPRGRYNERVIKFVK